MKVVIVPIVNLIALLFVLMVYLPTGFILSTIWNFRIDIETIKSYEAIIGDFKQTMKETFCSKFVFKD